jgi:hypothetical protein
MMLSVYATSRFVWQLVKVTCSQFRKICMIRIFPSWVGFKNFERKNFAISLKQCQLSDSIIDAHREERVGIKVYPPSNIFV